MRTNQAGIDLIKRWEGFVPHVYKDAAGYPTIGYGHLIKAGEHFASRISEGYAEQLLRQDIRIAEDAVNNYAKVPLTENQFAALVSFTYNVGGGAFKKSTLLKKLNQGKYDAVPKELLRWNRAGGRVLQGLTNRRVDEGKLFKLL